MTVRIFGKFHFIIAPYTHRQSRKSAKNLKSAHTPRKSQLGGLHFAHNPDFHEKI
jgi:hypothetical protein